MTKLKKLSIVCCYSLSGKGLEHLTKLSCLTELNVSDSNVLSTAGVTHLAQMIQLTALSAGGLMLEELCDDYHEMNDEVLCHMSNMTHMTRLDLSGNMYISDKGLSHIAQMTKLTSLSLAYCSRRLITDRGMRHFANMSDITELDLTNTAMSDDALAYLEHMTCMTTLNLRYTLVTDDGLVKLGKMKRLKHLDVICTYITKEGLLAKLGQATRFATLSVRAQTRAQGFFGCENEEFRVSFLQKFSVNVQNTHVNGAVIAYLLKLFEVPDCAKLQPCNKVVASGVGSDIYKWPEW